MKQYDYIRIAGVTIGYSFLFEETVNLFNSFYKSRFDEAFCQEPIVPRISLTQEDISIMERSFEPGDIGPFSEFNTLAYLTSAALILYDRFIFHGAAMLWKGDAWILTGDSGVGKTTQLRLWKKLFGKEVAIINGDKPVCQIREDGIIVHPSPWMGKEGYGGQASARLGGIIYLEQGKENRIEKMSVKDAVIPVYRQFKLFIKTEEEARKVAQLEDSLLKNIPVWKLTNVGDEDSVILTRRVLMDSMSEASP